MEPWAKRIFDLLQEGKAEGRSQKALAKACGLSQPSISQWFSDTGNKPATRMIMGDNLIAAARYLGTTPEYIMTGVGGPSSHGMGLDPDTLAAAIKLVRLTFRNLDVEHDFSQYLKRRIQEAGISDERVEGNGGSGPSDRGSRSRRKAG